MIFHCEICNIILYPQKIIYTLYLTNPESRAVVIRNSESKTVESSTSKSIPVASSDNNAPETGDNTAYAAIALAAVMSVLAVFVILGRRDKTNKYPTSD